MRSRPPGLELRELEPGDAYDVLTLQRAAFAREAEVYEDPFLPALLQTSAELEEELRRSIGIVAVAGTQMVGAIRMRRFEDILQINRLTVDPAMQGRGIGTALLCAAEAATTASRVSLFVRVRSADILRWYQRLGYAAEQHAAARADQEIAGLVKDLARARAARR